jgi:hypothetical protein
MTTKRRATMSLLAVVAGLVGMVAFLAGPAAADDGHHHDGPTSGEAFASNGSVASGSAVAINDSTASGDAVAIDGSVASGCSTAVLESTASGADCHGKKGHHRDHHAGPAKAVSGAGLALTGSSSASMVQMALIAFFAGLALVSLTHILRRQNT